MMRNASVIEQAVGNYPVYVSDGPVCVATGPTGRRQLTTIAVSKVTTRDIHLDTARPTIFTEHGLQPVCFKCLMAWLQLTSFVQSSTPWWPKVIALSCFGRISLPP